MHLFFAALGVACFSSNLVFASEAESRLAPVVIREERAPGQRAGTASEFSGVEVPVDPRGESSLVRLLSRRAGVYIQRAGGDEGHSAVSLRGQDPSQTRFFLEGIPLTDAQYHSAQLGWFPSEAIAAVDLFPEGSPAVLGGDGLGGAVVLRLPELGTEKAIVAARAGAFGSRRVFGRVAGDRLPVSVFVDAALSTEDFLYRDNAGTPLVAEDDRWTRRLNNGQQWLTVFPRVSLWQSPTLKVSALSFHSLRRNEIPGAVGLALHGTLDSQYHLAGLRAQGRGGPAEWELTAFGGALDQRFSAAQELSALQVQSSLSTFWGARAVLRGETTGVSWEVSSGVNADQASLSTSQASTLAKRWVLPVGASVRWLVAPGWELKPAVLAQRFAYSGAGERQSMAVSPRLGLDWEPTKSQRIRVCAGRYHRAPALAEMFGSPASVAANPALQDERAWKVDVGWDGRWPLRHRLWREVQVSATVSAAFAENLIVLVPNSQFNFVAQNIGRSRILTPELGVELGLGRDWTLRANAAFLSTVNLSTAAAYQGKALPMRPAFRGGVETQWSQGPWRITYSLQATGALYADAANTRRIGEYWEHGVWGSWSSSLGTWMLELRNLTDSTTVSGAEWNFSLAQNTTGMAGYPAPGRRVYFTWRYEI